ncbi:ALKBH6 isoform 14, partial [Pongo abelii]
EIRGDAGGRIGCKELVLMEEQDARVPALEPFRVEQVVRTQGTTCNLLCP